LKNLELKVVKLYVDLVMGAFESESVEKELPTAKQRLLESLEREKLDLTENVKLAKELSDAQLKALEEAGRPAGYVHARLATPGLVGMGQGTFKTVFEVGITFDPLLSVPYYPGSSVKGLVRYAFEMKYGCLNEEKKSSEECGALNELFGSLEAEGAVDFLDAYPIGCAGESCSLLEGAVVTPHYYRGGKIVDTPLEAEPVPVVHVVLSPGLIFRFVVTINDFERARSSLKRLGINIKNEFEVLKEILAELLRALRGGAFARSGKGYNVFEPYAQSVPRFKVVAFGMRSPRP